ncbi:hypothetical protein B4107_1186 [Bacillus safensis]|nr:hypothetical protein B4107_1186 [Bacillus safensis]
MFQHIICSLYAPVPAYYSFSTLVNFFILSPIAKEKSSGQLKTIVLFS